MGLLYLEGATLTGEELSELLENYIHQRWLPPRPEMTITLSRNTSVPPLDGSFYSKLGVGFSATLDDIRSAYKREALLHHPDRNAKDDCAAFQDIQEAYDVLRDERKRLGYDLTLKSKPKRRAPLKPRSMVRSPMLVACAGNVLRTIDIHESSFGMALRHGDMIETNVGRRGIVIGVSLAFLRERRWTGEKLIAIKIHFSWPPFVAGSCGPSGPAVGGAAV
eukprot:gene21603-33237_t